MRITTEDLGDRQVMLTIELEEERVDRALRGVARRLSKDYNIPGFRRGRAPYHIILQRFGREALLQEALDDLGQEVYEEALESENLEPYSPGTLEDIQLDPLAFKLRVSLRPTIELGDYRELRLDTPVVAVEDAEVEAELERIRQANAILEPADNRPAERGDWVSLDVSADVDGETLFSEDSYGMVLDPEDEEFEPGFSEQIVGLKVGEEQQFALTLGDKWGEERAGREALFSVTLREVRSRFLPDLDDDLARTVGDFDTLDELRQRTRDQFEKDAQREADSKYAEDALEALVEGAAIKYPPDLIENQIDDMVEDLERRLEPRGIALDDYFKLTGQTEDAFRTNLRPQAETIVRRGLALGELARRERLDVEGAEIEQRINLLSTSWGERAGEVRDILSDPDSVRSIASSLLTDKAVQRLVVIARGEAPPLEDEDQQVDQEPEAEAAAADSTHADAEGAVEVEVPAMEPQSASVGVDGAPGVEEDTSSEDE